MRPSRFAARAGLPCIAAAVLGAAGTASAIPITWDAAPGVPGNWNVATNWNPDQVPVGPGNPPPNDEARIENGGIAVIDATQGAQTTGSLILGRLAGQSGTLRISGGSLTTVNSDIRVGGNGLTLANGGNGTGTLEQTGGDIIMNAGNLNIAIGAADSFATGTYNMSGGSLLINSATILAVGNRGTGTVDQSGGSIYVRGAVGNAVSQVNLGRNAAAAGSSGSYTLSGGDLTVATLRYGNAVQTSGTQSVNTFNLQGTGLLRVGAISFINNGALATNTFNFTGGTLTTETVNIPLMQNGGTLSPADLNYGTGANQQPLTAAGVVVSQIGTTSITNAGGYFQNAGTLAIDVSAGGSDFVNVSGPATLAGGITVNELDGFDPAMGATFDILTATDVTNAATVSGTTPSGNFYEASIIPGGNGEILRLTVVPEPGALALVALGGLGMLARGRRRRA